MNILVTGADGFLGRSIVKELGTDHTVFKGTRHHDGGDNSVYVDLTDPTSIGKALQYHEVDAIINAAGIVDAVNGFDNNEVFTRNLLTAALLSKRALKRVIITGSAAEYGVMSNRLDSVSETEPLLAASGYGLAKVNEEKTALTMREKYGLPVVVARVFNPIGSGMKPRYLIPHIIEQVKNLQEGKDVIEISRLDAKRDYVDVTDVAKAFRAILDGDPSYDVYNVGSGKAISNADLLGIIFKAYALGEQPQVKETSSEPEPNIPSAADITRIQDDLGWHPQSNITDVVEEIVKDTHAN